MASRLEAIATRSKWLLVAGKAPFGNRFTCSNKKLLEANSYYEALANPKVPKARQMASPAL